MAPHGLRRALAATAALAMLPLALSACTGAPPAAAQPFPLLTGQHAVTIDRSLQYGAFTVEVGYAVYDEVGKSLTVSTRWTNLSDGYATAPSGFGIMRLRTPDADPVSGDPVGPSDAPVPAGESSELSFVWSYLEANPLADGQLVIGQDGGRLTTIALADGAGENQLAARPVPLDAWANLGAHTIHVTNALLSAGHLSDNTQADASHRVLHLDFDVWISTARRAGWVTGDYLALKLPDGTIVKPRDGVDSREMTWSVVEGAWAEFEVPDEGAGDYQLLLFRRAPGLLGGDVEGNSSVALPFTIDDAALAPVSPSEQPKEGKLPLPLIPARPAPDGTAPPEPAADAPFALEAAEVNVSGYAVRVTGGTFSPASHQLTLDVEARYLGAVADGEFSWAPSLTVGTVLEFAHRTSGSLLVAAGASGNEPIRTTLAYNGMPDDFDLHAATLLIGNNARISLGDGASAPAVPEWLDAKAERSNAGEFAIQVRSYRVGAFTGTERKPGQVELEISYDVTTSSDASQRTLFFNPTSQVFLSRDDGYVQFAPDQDTTGILQLEVGVPKRTSTTFVVPAASLEKGVVYLLVRSRDETDFPTPAGWLETTIPVVLTPAR